VRKEIEGGVSVEWLSKTPQDSDVIVRTHEYQHQNHHLEILNIVGLILILRVPELPLHFLT
jgi:hypothetical protein